MDIVQIKTGEKFLLRFPQSIKNGKFEYFVSGQGYKKTKVFKVLSVELPELTAWSHWDICKIMDQYGEHIAKEYMEVRVAGIVALRFLLARYAFYKKALNHIPENKQDLNFIKFFEMLPFDYFLSLIGIYTLDVAKFDSMLGKLDSDYKPDECTYKNESTSLHDYVNLKYGIEYGNFIESLLDVK